MSLSYGEPQISEPGAFPEIAHEGGGDVRPGGVEAIADPPDRGVATIVPARPDHAGLLRALEASGNDAVLRALHAVRAEMAERDGELRDVIARLGHLYERIADATRRMGQVQALPATAQGDDDALKALLRSVDALATVTEASVDRGSDLSRSLQHLVEALSGLATRVDRLVHRADESEARLERVGHVVEGLSDQMTMMGRRLGAPADRLGPRLMAVGTPDLGGGGTTSD